MGLRKSIQINLSLLKIILKYHALLIHDYKKKNRYRHRSLMTRPAVQCYRAYERSLFEKYDKNNNDYTELHVYD